jgi:hypothetical protein
MPLRDIIVTLPVGRNILLQAVVEAVPDPHSSQWLEILPCRFCVANASDKHDISISCIAEASARLRLNVPISSASRIVSSEKERRI